MGDAFDEIASMATGRADVLEPFRQYAADYIKFVAGEKEVTGGPPFARPLIGLKLDLPGGQTLAVRPGWTKSRRPTAGHPGVPGEFRLEVVTLVLVRELRLRLAPGRPPAFVGRVWLDPDRNRPSLEAICATADSFLRNPLATFGTQADRCACCRRPLTDLTSRTRVGPECVRWYRFFERDHPVARRYQARYRDIDAPFDSSADPA